MANFCTKCGSALVEGNNFCTSCGASVGGSSASAAPAAAASPKSGGALKVILIVVGVFIGLGILGGMAVTFGLWRASPAVQVKRPRQIRINTPPGKISVGPGAAGGEAGPGGPPLPRRKRAKGTFQASTP